VRRLGNLLMGGVLLTSLRKPEQNAPRHRGDTHGKGSEMEKGAACDNGFSNG
jgi:hypothetical protein